MSIESELFKIKEWYRLNWCLCIFCNHRVDEGDLAHLIRRSASVELQTVKLNTGLAHRSCHDIFDNKPGEALYLPRIIECLYIIKLMDEEHFVRMCSAVGINPHLFPPADQSITHHGELLWLS